MFNIKIIDFYVISWMVVVYSLKTNILHNILILNLVSMC